MLRLVKETSLRQNGLVAKAVDASQTKRAAKAARTRETSPVKNKGFRQ